MLLFLSLLSEIHCTYFERGFNSARRDGSGIMMAGQGKESVDTIPGSFGIMHGCAYVDLMSVSTKCTCIANTIGCDTLLSIVVLSAPGWVEEISVARIRR